MTNTPVPADCLRSFDTARKAQHSPSHDVVIIARILNPFMHGYERTWNVLESEGILRTSAKDLYVRTRRFLNDSNNAQDSYGTLIRDITDLFADAQQVLQKRWDAFQDIPEPDYFSVQTGHCFMQSLRTGEQAATTNLIQLNKANPFLMVHVAAEFLHDLDGDMASRHERQYLWSQKTDLFSRMHGYCHDLHNLIPFGLEIKDATEEQFQLTMSSLRYLYGMMALSEEANLYTYLGDVKRDFGILKAYIEPFGLPAKNEPKQDHPATLLEWDRWTAITREARARRDERRASMPPSFFPE